MALFLPCRVLLGQRVTDDLISLRKTLLGGVDGLLRQVSDLIDQALQDILGKAHGRIDELLDAGSSLSKGLLVRNQTGLPRLGYLLERSRLVRDRSVFGDQQLIFIAWFAVVLPGHHPGGKIYGRVPPLPEAAAFIARRGALRTVPCRAQMMHVH